MGIVIPRPAVRAREARMITARLDYCARSLAIGIPNDVAFKNARALVFDRKGVIKDPIQRRVATEGAALRRTGAAK